MKTIGLIGGTTYHSTIDYYRYINEGVHEKLGGFDYAKCILYSVNFGEVKKNNDSKNWAANLEILVNACTGLEKAGAEGIVLCANTTHMHVNELKKRISLPIIHIVEAVANEISNHKLKKVALLGTKFTMEMDFFKDKLKEQNIEAIIPDETGRDFIHWSIFEELGKGIFSEATKSKYLDIIQKLIANGAEGIILGCTEIPLLIHQNDLSVPGFDTTKIHSDAAVKFMTE